MKKITIPATSANLGPGYDCMGLALSLYNTIAFEFMDKGLHIDLPEKDRNSIPADARNLIYRVFCNTLHEHGKTPPGVRFKQTNDIPPVRGLGSSAACVVGGVVMADAYLGNCMTTQEMLEFCTAEDGHPDNVLPALVGGITVGCVEGRHVPYVRFDAPAHLQCAVLIPPFVLSTRKARAVLPSMVPFADAVFNHSHTALLSAALCTGELSLLRFAMQDRLHQPYRESLIPNYAKVVEIACRHGALSSCLSGAGPTIIAFLDGSEPSDYIARVQKDLDDLGALWQAQMLQIDRQGCTIE